MPSHFVSKKIPSRLKYADTGRRSDVPDNARTCAHTPRHTQTQTDGHTHTANRNTTLVTLPVG